MKGSRLQRLEDEGLDQCRSCRDNSRWSYLFYDFLLRVKGAIQCFLGVFSKSFSMISGPPLWRTYAQGYLKTLTQTERFEIDYEGNKVCLDFSKFNLFSIMFILPNKIQACSYIPWSFHRYKLWESNECVHMCVVLDIRQIGDATPITLSKD